MSASIRVQTPPAETEFVEIPATGLKVSRVALGTWAMGGWMWGGTDHRESVATIHAALSQGINLIDTAPVYGFGVSEEIVGAALGGVRTQVAIATKAGANAGTARSIAMRAAPESCRRSTPRCAACAPISSIFIRFAGPAMVPVRSRH